MMEYEEFETLLPVLGKGKMTLGLDATRELMGLLGDPQDKVPTIHIAGTNGKGSTAIMIATILEQAGYKVGLFTSPALVDFNERIQINRQPISDKDLIAVANLVRQRTAESAIHFTEFELFAAMAWVAFEQANCDIIVLEVGLGGRLDATNIIKKPLITIITKIALDHQIYLGETLGEIATEKAGILKSSVPLILYPQNMEAEQAIIDRAKSLNCPVTHVDLKQLNYELSNSPQQAFEYKNKKYNIQLLEEHQIMNAGVAIETAHLLNEMVGFTVSEFDIQNGLAKTKWPARFEYIQVNPTLIVDGSHNVDGIEQLKKNLLRYFPGRPRIAIIGMLKDKDYEKVLKIILPIFDKVITVAPDTPRALSAAVLATEIESFGAQSKDNIVIADDYKDALIKSDLMVKSYDDQKAMICAFGSFYYVGYIRRLLQK